MPGRFSLNAFAPNKKPSVNKLADNSAWYDPVLDAVFQNMTPKDKSLPTRTLLETIQGNKNEITEKNFSPEHLAVMADLIRIAGPGKPVTYATYQKLYKERKAKTGKIPLDTVPGLASVYDPIGQVQTTLGQFNTNQTPQGIQIADTYDFNPAGWGSEISATAGPYGIIRSYAGRKIPPGRGRRVNIAIRPTLK